jgi:hypothetical protein
MSDVAKILLSAGVGLLAGLVSGIFLGPFKAWYLRKHAAKRAQREIYKELCNLYEVFCLSDRRNDEYYCHIAITYNPPENFAFYYSQHREACFLIKGWRGIKVFMKSIRLLEMPQLKEDIAELGCRDIISTQFKKLRNCLRNGLKQSV